jgi:hypothetical protein
MGELDIRPLAHLMCLTFLDLRVCKGLHGIEELADRPFLKEIVVDAVLADRISSIISRDKVSLAPGLFVSEDGLE